MTFSDSDTRHMVIELLTAPTARDAQVKIGASNLSNQCDYCLASNLLGDMRETPMTDRAWGGRVLGTAIHSILEERAGAPWFKERHPDALTEYRMHLGEFPGYGKIGSTADLVLPSERHAFDYKGTDDRKSALVQDYLAISRGEEPPYGRKHQVHKAKTISETVYEEEMAKAEYKISGYYGQLQAYGLGLNREGIPIDTLSNVFVSRTNTMWFDNPASDRYDDPTRMHGIWVLTFPYDEAYALAVWQRGLDIWAALQAGAVPASFEHHKHCFPCGLEVESGAIAA